MREVNTVNQIQIKFSNKQCKKLQVHSIIKVRANERLYTDKENYFMRYFRHERYISSKLDRVIIPYMLILKFPEYLNMINNSLDASLYIISKCDEDVILSCLGGSDVTKIVLTREEVMQQTKCLDQSPLANIGMFTDNFEVRRKKIQESIDTSNVQKWK